MQIDKSEKNEKKIEAVSLTDQLHQAIQQEDLGGINRLLFERADVNKLSKYRFAALHVAAKVKNMDVIDVLLKARANVDALVFTKMAPVHFAAEEGNLPSMKKLLDDAKAHRNYMPGNAGFYFDLTPLHLAAEEGNLPFMQKLLDAKANINGDVPGRYKFDEYTPLHAGVRQRKPEVVKLLLHHQAAINTNSVNLGTPLYQAAGLGEVAIASLLIDKNADLNMTYRLSLHKVTAIMVASEKNHFDIVEKLIEAKAYTDLSQFTDETVPPEQAEEQIEEHEEELEEEEAEESCYFNLFLHSAVKSYNPKLLHIILRTGVDIHPDKRDPDGRSIVDLILMCPVKTVKAEMIEILSSYLKPSEQEALNARLLNEFPTFKNVRVESKLAKSTYTYNSFRRGNLFCSLNQLRGSVYYREPAQLSRPFSSVYSDDADVVDQFLTPMALSLTSSDSAADLEGSVIKKKRGRSEEPDDPSEVTKPVKQGRLDSSSFWSSSSAGGAQSASVSSCTSTESVSASDDALLLAITRR